MSYYNILIALVAVFLLRVDVSLGFVFVRKCNNVCASSSVVTITTSSSSKPLDYRDRHGVKEGEEEQSSCSRRDVLNKAGTGLLFGVIATLAGNNEAEASTIEACRENALNCIRTEWIPPTGTSKSAAIKTLRDVIQAYPQKGQSGIDCSGFLIAEDDLDGKSAFARIEYRSCVGPAAIAVNLAQPFVDDLKLQVGESGTVQVRSSSRMGSRYVRLYL